MSRSELRVLLLFTRLKNSGAFLWLYELGQAWGKCGVRTAVFYMIGSIDEVDFKPPSELEVRPGVPPGRRFRTAAPLMVWRLLQQVRRCDVLIVNTYGPVKFAGYVAARVLHRQIVGYSQGIVNRHMADHTASRTYSSLNRWCLRHLDAVFCISPQLHNALVEIGVRPSRIVEIRTGIDVEQVRRLASEGEPVVTSGSGETLIVASGRLHPTKRFDRIIIALADLTCAGTKARLVILGADQGEGSRLRELAAEQGVSDLVVFAGPLVNPMPQYRAADVFVHSADYEPIGLVLLESLAVGTPVIAHDSGIGGPALVLDGGRYGELIDMTEASALSDALAAFVDDPSLLRERARQGVAYVRSTFSTDTAADAALLAMQRLCDST